MAISKKNQDVMDALDAAELTVKVLLGADRSELNQNAEKLFDINLTRAREKRDQLFRKYMALFNQ